MGVSSGQHFSKQIKQKVLKQLPLLNHQLSYTLQILFISLRLHTIDGSQHKANTSIPASSLAVWLTDASPGPAKPIRV